MPWRPNPFPNLAPPIPSSVTTRRIQLPSSSALIVTCFARACTLRDLDAFPELLDRVWAALLANVYDIFAAWLDDQNTRRGTPIVDAPATAAVLLASLTYAPILDALIGHIPADIDHARYRSAWVAPRAQHAHDRGICAVAVVERRTHRLLPWTQGKASAVTSGPAGTADRGAHRTERENRHACC